MHFPLTTIFSSECFQPLEHWGFMRRILKVRQNFYLTRSEVISSCLLLLTWNSTLAVFENLLVSIVYF